MKTRARPTRWAAAGVVVLALAAGSCSKDDDSPGAGPDAPAGSSATEPAVVTEVSFGKVTGALPGKARDQLSDQIQQVVDGWYDAAYLGDGSDDEWPGFTKGAQAEARRDQDLMSGGRGLEATQRRLKIDVLAVKKKPVGVTAHVRLKLVSADSGDQGARIAGRLYLTPTKQGWQIFGYDMTKAGA